MLGPIDVILVAIRWVHALAGAVWVGGGLFYVLVLQPSLDVIDDQPMVKALRAGVAREFKEIVELGMMGLAITGAILAFDRLSQGNVSNLYVGILVAKIIAAGGMFALARPLGQKKPRFAHTSGTTENENDEGVNPLPSFLKGVTSPTQLVLILGVSVFFLASMLQVVFEKHL